MLGMPEHRDTACPHIAPTPSILAAQSIDDERLQALLDDMAKYKKFE